MVSETLFFHHRKFEMRTVTILVGYTLSPAPDWVGVGVGVICESHQPSWAHLDHCTCHQRGLQHFFFFLTKGTRENSNSYFRNLELTVPGRHVVLDRTPAGLADIPISAS